jgi:hypothetical protein
MKPSLLATGCEKIPASPDLQYVPPNSSPYKVSGKDSWWTLAERPEVKLAGLSALDLCAFNFRTRTPAEINWYLRNKVGCTTATSDRKNYVFSDDAAPGIVYLPKPSGAKGPIDLGEFPISGEAPSPNPISAVEEFQWEAQSQIRDFRHVRGRIKVTLKGVVNWGSLSPEAKLKAAYKFGKKEFAPNAEFQLANEFSVQVGAKIKPEDVTSFTGWKKAVRESAELTVKRKLKLYKGLSVGTSVFVPKDGLFFAIKVNVLEWTAVQADLGWILNLPKEDAGVSAKLNVEIAFLLGPSAEVLARARMLLLNPGTFAVAGLLGWVSFAGYGIAHTMNKADRLAFESWYITGYVDAVFPPHGAGGPQLPFKPEDRRRAEEMMRLGRQDAEATARSDFSDLGLPPMQAYRAYMLSVMDASEDAYGDRQPRRLLRELVAAKLSGQTGA